MWKSATAIIMKKLEDFMVCESNFDEHFMEIVRSFFTTAMILANAQPDCILADGWLSMIYGRSAVQAMMEYEDFENFMYEYLV